MKIRLLSITHKAPNWINEGYEDYVKRLPPSCPLEFIPIPAEKRTSHADLARITQREGEKLLAAIKPNDFVIAMSIDGKLWSTEQLAQELKKWQQGGRDIALLVGGPEGLAASCLERANQKWSLSPLTFPHIIVRVLIAEQIYRASSILQQHPYHR